MKDTTNELFLSVFRLFIANIIIGVFIFCILEYFGAQHLMGLSVVIPVIIFFMNIWDLRYSEIQENKYEKLKTRNIKIDINLANILQELVVLNSENISLKQENKELMRKLENAEKEPLPTHEQVQANLEVLSEMYFGKK